MLVIIMPHLERRSQHVSFLKPLFILIRGTRKISIIAIRSSSGPLPILGIFYFSYFIYIFLILSIFQSRYSTAFHILFFFLIFIRFLQPEAGPLNKKTMEDTTFESLSVKVGAPYLYTHQGDCSHIIIVTDIRLINKYFSFFYPLFSFIIRCH